MIRTEIERRLREAIGLHAETVGASVVNYAIKQRMAACRTTDPAEYLALLKSSRAELQELINAVIIPETWFFRDREAFAAMVRHAQAHRRPGVPVRMLSLPCSTGEEPFSMAMAMFDAGFAATDFTIDGMDVSTRNVEEAGRAVYGRNSFRGADLAFRDRHFDRVDNGYRPSEAVLRQVHLRAGNLFDASAPLAAESYDVVFCRNLLIYFDRALQERALGRLRQLLVPDGLLLVGPAESSLPTLFGFTSARIPMAFAFRKQAAAAVRPAPIPVRPPPRLARPVRPAVSKPAPIRAAPPLRTPMPTSPPVALADPAGDSLASIERAANAGRLDEAREAAREHIDTFGPSAEIHYLLGLALGADGSPAEAIEHYRKALYLAPDHREALAHLALLLQSKGDAAGAKALTDRLGRIEKRSATR